MPEAPAFWYRPPGLAALCLTPLTWLWRAGGAWRRARSRAARVGVPVISVGNLTVGGTGKTPVVEAIAHRLGARGRAPHIVTRGYGGRLAGPVRVDPARHRAEDVGDEPLLLAQAAPTWVARDRAAGARAAVAAGAEAVILDDGHQNEALRKDLALVVVDAATEFGNGRLVPAGPLREGVARGLARADAIILMGAGPPATAVPAWAPADRPFLRARLAPVGAEGLAGLRALAFAGIGRPAKFFETVAEAGLVLAATRAFPDHHPYDAREMSALSVEAASLEAMLVTTQKDWVRLEAPWRPHVATIMVQAVFEAPDVLDALLARVLP